MDASPDFPRQSRAPVFNMPGVVTASIAVLIVIQAIREYLLSDLRDISIVLDLALVPARWTVWFDPSRVAEVIQAAGSGDAQLGAMREAFARYVTGQQSLEPWTLATYALLHGSWMHVLFNSVWLAAFGSPVARRFSSTVPAAAPRGPTMICQGWPMRSASANLTPARSARSS